MLSPSNPALLSIHDEVMNNILSCDLPDHMHDGIYNYVMYGIPPGGFFLSVLKNDLVGAAGHADHINATKLKEYASYVYNCLPQTAWKNEKNISLWIAHQGYSGLHKVAALYSEEEAIAECPA